MDAVPNSNGEMNRLVIPSFYGSAVLALSLIVLALSILLVILT